MTWICQFNPVYSVVCERSVLCPNSLRHHGLEPARLFCACDFPGKNIGVGCHFLLQGIFLTQGSNPRLLQGLRWQADSLALQPRGCPELRAVVQPGSRTASFQSAQPCVLYKRGVRQCFHFHLLWGALYLYIFTSNPTPDTQEVIIKC